MRKIAYLGMDVHQNHCVLGEMASVGEFMGTSAFPTSERHIVHALQGIEAKEKRPTLEEGNLARWVAQVASPDVTDVLVCDPKENASAGEKCLRPSA